MQVHFQNQRRLSSVWKRKAWSKRAGELVIEARLFTTFLRFSVFSLFTPSIDTRPKHKCTSQCHCRAAMGQPAFVF